MLQELHIIYLQKTNREFKKYLKDNKFNFCYCTLLSRFKENKLAFKGRKGNSGRKRKNI